MHHTSSRDALAGSGWAGGATQHQVVPCGGDELGPNVVLTGDPSGSWFFTLELVTELKWQKYILPTRFSMTIDSGSISLLLTCTKQMISRDTFY